MLVEISKRRFTADDYQQMGRAGILTRRDRVELIDGDIIAMTPIGPAHCANIDRATRAFVMQAGDRAIVRVQGSVRLNMYTEPEPDLVLLRPRADFYASALPGPDDILLIVEVADSSIEYDREVKTRVYAAAGVREYWIADLAEQVLLCYTSIVDGRYATRRRRRPGESIAPELLPDCTIAVDVLAGGV